MARKSEGLLPIPFLDFVDQFFASMGLPKEKHESMQKALSLLIVDQEEHVTPLTCKNMVAWFGPTTTQCSLKGMTDFFPRFYELLQQPWFFGKLDFHQAETKLGNHPGTFLVRLNAGNQCESNVSPFTIVMAANGGWEPQHLRVYVRPDNPGLIVKLTLPDGTKKKVSTDYGIQELIKRLQQKENTCDQFRTPCPGSTFPALVGATEAHVNPNSKNETAPVYYAMKKPD